MAKLGRWVAKLGRWVAKVSKVWEISAKHGDGWLSRGMGGQVGRWVAKLVARLLATAALWVRIEPSLKNTKKWAT